MLAVFVDWSAGLSTAAFSAGLSATALSATGLSTGLSADAGFSAAVFSSRAFSEMPLALNPGAGMLATSTDFADVLLTGFAGSVLASAVGSVVETAAATGAFTAGLVMMWWFSTYAPLRGARTARH